MPFSRHESPSYQKFLKEFIQDSCTESNREDSQADNAITEQDANQSVQLPFLKDAESNETLTFDSKMPFSISANSLGPNHVEFEQLAELQGPESYSTPFFDGNQHEQNEFFENSLHDDMRDDNQLVDLSEIDLKELDRELLENEDEGALEKDITDAAVEFSFNPFMMNSIDEEQFEQDHFNRGQEEFTFQKNETIDLNDHDLEELERDNQSIMPETPAKFTHHHEPTVEFDHDACNSSNGQSKPISSLTKKLSPRSHIDMIASLQRDLVQAHANLHTTQKETAILKSLLKTSEIKVKELLESRKAIEREQEVTLLRVKRDLLGEKEQLLLDLRQDFQLQVSSLEKEHSTQIELVRKEKENSETQASVLKNQLITLQQELDQKSTQFEIAIKRASTDEEKNRIGLQGAVNRAQIEIDAIKSEMESLNSQYQKEKKAREDNQEQLEQKNQECINLSILLQDQKIVNSKLVEEKNSIVNSLKPPTPPNYQSKLQIHSNSADVLKETVEKLFTTISPVVDIPSSIPLRSPDLLVESLSLLVDHTLKQSKKIEELQKILESTEPINSWNDIECQYPNIVGTFLQEQSFLHKQQMKNVVDGLKKEYLKTYDAALGRMLEQTKHHSQMRVTVLERELESLREWKNSVSMHATPSRSIQGASYSITSTRSHHQQESPLKQKYIETLKEMRDQVDKATKTSLTRLEVEWKKRAKSLDAEWKNRIANILERYRHRNRSDCTCTKEFLELIKSS